MVKDERPAAGPGVPRTGAIGVELDVLQRISHSRKIVRRRSERVRPETQEAIDGSRYTCSMPQISLYRVEVRPKPGMPDPRGAAALREAESLGLARAPDRIDSASVYLLEGELDEDQIQHLTVELLADPVTEQPHIGATPPNAAALIEVHPL